MLGSRRSSNIFGSCSAGRDEVFPVLAEQSRDMGTVKAIFGILAIVAIIYGGFQIIPPELSNYSFQDDLRNIAMMGGANPRQTDQELVDAVMKKAKDHDITLVPEQVTVQRIGTPGAPAVYVAADYSVPVNLPGYSFTLHFTPSSGNRGF
jgi:hypothetical protein